MVFVKKSKFLSSVLFGQIKTKKIVFLLFCIKKILHRPEKGSFKKQQKIEIFQRGQSMVFVKKSKFLSSVLFGQIKTKKIVFLLFCIKKILHRPEKGSFKKQQKIEIFQRGQSMVFVKKSNCLSSVFFGQIKPEKIVLVFRIKKNALETRKRKF